MLYVDSNIFIYPIIYDEASIEKASRCRQFLLKIAMGRVEACTSTLTWDEVVWVVRRIVGEEQSISQGRRLLGFPNLRFLEIKEITLQMAQEIMEKYRLKPRDALHIATAIENGVKTIVSYDGDIDKANIVRRIEP